MKKFLALLLALAMMLCLMTACASEETAEEAPAKESAEAPVSEAPAEEETPVEDAPVEEPVEEDVYPLGEDIVLTAFTEFRSTDTGGMIASRSETKCFEYAAEVTGVSLKTTDVSQQTFSESFNLLMASGDYPDLIFNVNSYYTSGMDAAIEDDIVVDLAPYLEEYAPNYYGLMEENPQTKKDTHTDTGKVGQFFTIENEPQNRGSGYFIRSDILAQVGLEAPHTIDEYYNVLMAIKDQTDIEYPMYVGSTGIGSIATAYGVGGISVGGGFTGVDLNYVIEDGVVDVPYFHENYKTVLTIMKKWLDDGIYSRDFITQSTETMPPDANYYAAITDGECALFSYTSGVTDLVADAREKIPDFALEPTRTMVVNEGDILPSTTTVTLVDSNGFAVSTQCEDLEIAMRYLDWWYGEEGSLTASYGIEGESYYIDENGEPQWTEMIMNGDGQYTTNQLIYCYCIQSEVGKIDIHRTDYRTTEDEAYVNEVWNQDVDFTKGESMSRFVTMTAEESESYSSQVNDIATYISETVPRFILGDLNLEGDLDAFIQNLYDMGIEDCIAIKQDVYNRYLSR